MIGLAVGALGGGGSVLAVPVFVYVLGQDVHQATTASLVVITAAALGGALGHARKGRVCWRHAGVFTAAAVPGVVAGTVAGDAVSGDALLGAFALVMLGASYATWRKAVTGEADDEGEGSVCPPLRVGPAMGAGVAIGLLTGFFGVGGGFLIVPALAIGLALRTRNAIATSLAIITAISAVGLVVHLLAGRTVEVDVTVAMTAACVAGALAGVAVAGRVPRRVLGRAFAVLVAAVAAYLLVASAFLGGPPGSS